MLIFLVIYFTVPDTKPRLKVVDASGQKYTNDIYSLDLIHQAGVRYIWDGELVKGVIGQDRQLNRFQWYKESATNYSVRNRAIIAVLDILTGPLSEFRNLEIFDFSKNANAQYAPIEFPDGTKFYSFKRYGSWGFADIDGVAKVIARPIVRELIKNQGTMVLYTHLGKRNYTSENSTTHLPDATKEVFYGLADAYNKKELNLSSTSKLLDYLVLRDNISLRHKELRFNSDSIRFSPLSKDDLAGHAFGLAGNIGKLRVFCDEMELHEFELTSVGNYKLLRFRDKQE